MPPDEAQESAATGSTEATAAPAGGGIKSAAEVIEKVLSNDERPTRPDPAPGKPADKKPARRVEKLEAASAEKTVEAAPEPDAEASANQKARFHLQHGDVAKAIDAAFGDLKALSETLPDGVREALARKLGVSSAQWEKVRKYEQNAKRTIAAKENELRTVIGQLQEEFRPFHEARTLYKAGDYDAAFKAAFGEDAADYQRKIIGQRVGKNPEIEALKAQLEERDRKQAEREAAEERARAEAEETRQVHAYLDDTQAQCRASEDAAIRKYAERPAFIQRIYAIQKANYDAGSNTTIPLGTAAEMARDEILASLQQWSVDDTGAPSANAARASALPAKPPAAKAPARALKQSQAAEGTGQTRKLTDAEKKAHWARQMEQATD